MTTFTPPEVPRHRYAHNAPPSPAMVELFGQRMQAMPGYDAMPPFLMSIVSATDLWMYLSSRGGLTAGRVEPARSIFPYEAEDKIHTCHPFCGPSLSVRVKREGEGVTLWRPFMSAHAEGVERCLYKNALGTQVVFEEVRPDLGLRVRYRWATAERFGFVRTVWLENLEEGQATDVEVLDGLRNLLPAGTALATMQKASSLVNAYTQAELDPETGLGVYALTAAVMDTAEPGESLKANVVWSHVLEPVLTTLLPDAVDDFGVGLAVRPETRTRNRRPAYLTQGAFTLAPGEIKHWHVVADADRTQPQVVLLRRRLRDPETLDADLEEAIAETGRGLNAYIAAADGMQCTGDTLASTHHAVNVMFNGMRGGFIAGGYNIDLADFTGFVRTRNRPAAERLPGMLPDPMPKALGYDALRDAAAASGDADLIRLTLEYLPLTFGRRHGDPSRPWNLFAIRVQQPDGSRILDYQGNWRDIFQNWEALARSYPGYLAGMVAKFVNASTLDGFNPYRISRDGLDWEVPDPHDPWAHIGYWGDHQIIYLLKLMEQLHAHDPDGLRRMLHEPVFSYADVPYRIKAYAELVKDPSNSIVFDWDAHRATQDRAEAMGTDGRLVQDAGGRVRHVTLAEKLMVSLLAKVSNLAIGGGVWMNTQRPEWNDANNALAGSGLSVVTACYLLRFAEFAKALFAGEGDAPLPVAEPVLAWLTEVSEALAEGIGEGLGDDEEGVIDDAARRAVLDRMGLAFERYRDAVYGSPEPATAEASAQAISGLLDRTAHACRMTLRANRREDGLYHGYNLLAFANEGMSARVDHLPLMLEGQVAVLSSGFLSPDESAGIIESLFASPLYRQDINTFILYPYRDLPGFLDRNRVDTAEAESNPLVKALLKSGDRSVIERDAAGSLRFNSGFVNARDLEATLDRLADAEPGLASLTREHRRSILELYEDTFNHHAFTGRSGTMYGYEGLGCVYWHMVAKLLLAVQENCVAAAKAGDASGLERCMAAYRRVRSGLGFEQTPEGFGAFPLDPYSHTPFDRGAQQPGMTGQVKEEVLTRFGELGVQVEDGRLGFVPELMQRSEFLEEPTRWVPLNLAGDQEPIDLPNGSLGFTVCQVPVVVHTAEGASGRITVTGTDGSTSVVDGLRLDAATSAAVFARSSAVRRLEVVVPAEVLGKH
ncbi:MAG: hypothetical protein AAGI68_04675 [Planctomycetota bacterium]